MKRYLKYGGLALIVLIVVTATFVTFNQGAVRVKAASDTGYVNPAANAAATGGDGNGFQTNPTNAYTDNATFAVDTDSGTNTTTTCTDAGKDRHVFYSYNLSAVPSGATIEGIEVRLDMKVDATTGSPKSCVEISWDGGTSWTAAKTTATLARTEKSYILGGAADTWGRTWSASELANLRVRVTNVASNISRDFSLDWVPVKVYYSATLPAGTYYVDCSAGTNGDGSQASPWNNLTTVNGSTFSAGSSILLKRGATCSGQLWPKGSGASGNPNIIDAYGTGNKPIVAGGGTVMAAVYLYNQEYWEIRNLEVTNTGATAAERYGVEIILQDFGTGDYYRITGLTVHGVNGNSHKDQAHGGGIYVGVNGTTTQTKFNDVVIDGNTVYAVDFFGIATGSSWWCRAIANCSSGATWVGWTANSLFIRNNTVYDVGGDAIVPINTVNALIEYNVAHDFHNRSDDCAAGMWPWNADGTVFQYNESYLGRLTASTCDGSGYDNDYGTNDTVFQYNYSHDNEGGFLLACGPSANGSADGVVRYNISENDQYHVFVLSGPSVVNLQIYNNTLYIQNATYIVEEGNWNGYPTSTYFKNNIIYNVSSATYSMPAGKTYFDYNIFYGNHPASEPADAHKLTSNPLLVNPGSGGTGRNTVDGYKLQAGSPALASGVIIANNGGLDYWGNTVPASCAPDRGAHQYSSAAGCPTPTPAPPTATPDPTQNKVVNPGFETGSLSPWGQWNDMSVVNNNQRTGTYCLRAGNSPASSEQTLSGLTPGATYTLSAWAKLASGAGGDVRIGVKTYGGTEIQLPVTATSYTQVSTDFTMGSSNTTAIIYCYRASGTGYAYCDDFSVTAK